MLLLDGDLNISCIEGQTTSVVSNMSPDNTVRADTNQSAFNQSSVDSAFVMDNGLNISNLSEIIHNMDADFINSNYLNMEEYNIVDNILIPINCEKCNDRRKIEDIASNSTDHNANVIKTTQEVHHNLRQGISDTDNSEYNSDCDKITKDPDYSYSNSESSDEENNVIVNSSSTKSNSNAENSLQTSINVSGDAICDNVNLHVDNSKPNGAGKKNFCFYCKTLQSKIGRHLETVHKNEKEVKQFLVLPKGTYNTSLW